MSLASSTTASAPLTISKHDNTILDVVMSADGELAPPLPKSESSSGEDDSAPKPVTASYPIDAELLASVKLEEVRAVAAVVQTNDLAAAVKTLSELIARCPQYASLYNNRAQAYRLQEDYASALTDLNEAIKLASAANDVQVLKQAYTQRGVVRKKLGDEDQDAIANDFEKGAMFGNKLARVAAVQENPYAKLCGAMVKEMMSEFKQQQ
ncbi:hypothetical protein GQ42DRAFT_161886 [Ramicandelaber brevisporus]|nr:hypothetical protein GQ42DRAFT_161886 [Ramicandelaber brevisporus]